MGTGERRAIDAAEQAVASPLLETSMEGARSILLSITGGRDISLWEVNEAAKAVAEAAHPDANIIFGAMVDEKLDDQVWVTVVATGYRRPPPAARGARFGERKGREEPHRAALREPRRRAAGQPGAAKQPSSPLELDVPEFIPPEIADRRGRGRPARGASRPATRSARGPAPMCCATGGNAVDAALGAMLASFACEPLLTGLGAGGYMLVAAAGRAAGAAGLLRRGAGAGRRPRPRGRS